MLVRHDERVPIARLLTFLEHGERMAHDCATAQAALSDDSGTRRFLLSQAKQEAMHARVFQGAIAWLAAISWRRTLPSKWSSKVWGKPFSRVSNKGW
jgi:hypothetical protein